MIITKYAEKVNSKGKIVFSVIVDRTFRILSLVVYKKEFFG